MAVLDKEVGRFGLTDQTTQPHQQDPCWLLQVLMGVEKDT